MKYFIEIISNKAKNDVNEIVKRLGYKDLSPIRKSNSGVSHFLVKALGVARILTKMRKGDVLFLQYPMKKFYKMACLFAHAKGAKVVTVVHDLGAFRRHKLTPEQENRRLSHTDFLIVHNEKMRDYVKAHGFKGTLYCLGIFDYLSDSTPADYVTPHKPWTIVYAGGLGRWRNAFLYDIDKYAEGYVLDIYGRGFDTGADKDWSHVRYKGFAESEQFIAKTEADFGLVWDGASLDECTGDWGEYLKINNPHKTSFYLRAGIPVIVWKEAAMAPFVVNNGIGICVASLREIGSRLAEITPDDYARMRANAARTGRMIGEGHYITEGLKEAEKLFGIQ